MNTTESALLRELTDELRHAHTIIGAMLNNMTVEQKLVVHARLDIAGASGEGMTRANERSAVLGRAAAHQDQTDTKKGLEQ